LPSNEKKKILMSSNCIAQVHCSPQVLDSWKLMYCKTYLFTSKLFLSFLNGRGAVCLKWNHWRDMKELNLKR